MCNCPGDAGAGETEDWIQRTRGREGEGQGRSGGRRDAMWEVGERNLGTT